jgi:hypothetical protein
MDKLTGIYSFEELLNVTLAENLSVNLSTGSLVEAVIFIRCEYAFFIRSAKEDNTTNKKGRYSRIYKK